ncbi:MAG: aminotransferase class I/II-fold pyridoxal phosphate-dependent enzyme [Spirochaetaceae bacterium]|nr:aminotransferase class I/II-fold pyridoxal phosphate-dependent enzyme [Spirochaetaceae bacterium]
MASSSSRINFQYDGLALSPMESSRLLDKILQGNDYTADAYSQGGAVETLELKMAEKLGKEQAIFMPTGTLANHLALKTLAGNRHRILIQEKSHIYNDSGDCMQELSGMNLIPLKNEESPETAGFTLEQLKAALGLSSEGKVRTEVGVISIESPVRRQNGMVFPWDEVQKIVEYAKKSDIRTHLDGARLFIAAAYAGITPAEYAAPFDTVYVSLYKYFNAPFGAILAGTRKVIEGMYHQRRMFGGGLNEAWPSAVLSLNTLNGFELRYRSVMELTVSFKSLLNNLKGLHVENLKNGTNVFRLNLDGTIKADILREELLKQGIQFPIPEKDFNGFYLKTNESLITEPFDDVVLGFENALSKSRSM